MSGSIITPSMARLAKQMNLYARSGIFDGRTETVYFTHCRRVHDETGTVLILTRDIGYHSSGWFKNPDYERCFHLSVSFWDMLLKKPRPYEPALARTWCSAVYGDWTRFIWEEGPSEKTLPEHGEAHHFRVMCDPLWQPIIPRGEVYSREFIEEGWLSWSDQQYEKAKLP